MSDKILNIISCERMKIIGAIILRATADKIRNKQFFFNIILINNPTINNGYDNTKLTFITIVLKYYVLNYLAIF